MKPHSNGAQKFYDTGEIAQILPRRCSTKQTGPQEMDSLSILSATATPTNNVSTIYAVGKLLDAYSLECNW